MRTVLLTCAWCGATVERGAAEANKNARLGRLAYCSRSHMKLANPSVNPATVAPLSERVMSKVRVEASGCWVWQGSAGKDGYGRMVYRLDGQRVIRGAHRVSWEVANGPIPEGMHVLHRCDNPPCVNPAHLFLGTQADNMRDMTRKGRHWQLSGR